MPSGRKLTHEEFLDKFNKQNKHAQDIQILGTYVNNRTKIKCKCKIDAYEWETTPDILLRGSGCPICGGSLKKTHEEFIKDLQQVNSDIEILGTYVNMKTKIKCKCKIDGNEWESTPNRLLSGHGCPICGRKTVGEKLAKTHEQFIQALYKINENIEILGTYANAHTKIKCKCKICGYEWEVVPSSLLRGIGCPKCAGNLQKTHEEFIKELAQINNNIEVLGTYETANTKILCRCKLDGYEWEVRPIELLRGRGCPKCSNHIPWTHNEFLTRLNEINSNIVPLQEYKNSQTPIKCKCKIDGHIWEVRPNSLLQGYGCPKCSNRKLSEQRTKTHEQFIKELALINPHIEVLGTYVKGDTNILCKCKLDGYEWEATPGNLLSGTGCPICSRKKANEKLTKTHEEFLQELIKVNNKILVLETYNGATTPIKCKCKIDGYEWEASPSNLLKGTGCPVCAVKNITKTHEQFIEELRDKNKHFNNIEVLGTYVTNKTKIKCRCKVDGYEWEPTPDSLLRGQGCPICGEKQRIQKQTKTHEQFIQELQQINTDIEILGTYVNAKTKIKCRCKLDGYEWKATPNSLLLGQGCPKCKITKGEKRVAQYLDNLGIEYIYNMGYFKDLVGTGGGLLRPDFIIPSLRLWIEYDGIQHYEPIDFSSKMSEEQVQQRFEYTQQNDQIKNQYAEQHNWTLIRIAYWDYDNIEKILDSYLKQEEELAL